MRVYSPASEEALRARNDLKDWAGEGFLDKAQHQTMLEETECDLRRTNIFLRLALFFFSLIILGAASGLFFEVFLSHPSEQTVGVLLLVFAPIAYAAAEFAATRAKLYRFGIEEALLLCSVGFLCLGMELAFFHGSFSSTNHPGEFMAPMSGVIAALWIWHRFGLHYAFLGSMIFAVWLANEWTADNTSEHVIVAILYAIGLAALVFVSPRYRFTCFENDYSIAEALLWAGIYVAINLQLSSIDELRHWLSGMSTASGFPRAFYWTTWPLTWCLPPLMLARGIREKNRFVMAAGATAAVLTLVTNKPYLGWPRHTWDPMLLGILLSGVALSVRRWLSHGPEGVRRGFTARRLSGKDKQWMGVASVAFGVASAQAAATNPPARPEVKFGGGDAGGGGASSDF